MREATLRPYLQRLVQLPGVRAAGFVDCASGMAVLHEGSIDRFDQLSETAVEFWRLHQRRAYDLHPFGSLTSISLVFEDLSVKLQPPPASLVGERVADWVTVLVMDWG